MKTIATMKGPEFLRHCNKIRYAVESLLKETRVMEIRKTPPKLTGKESKEEKERLTYEQAKKNISKMLDVLLEEYPEKTYEVLKLMCVPEDGEEIDGIDLALVGLEIILTPKVMNFFTSLATLGLKSTGS